MNPWDDERAVMVGKLTAGGVTNATMNPAASPPCTLVGAPRDGGRGPVGIGAWPAVIPVHIMRPPPGDDSALTAALDQLALVFAALGYAPYTWTTYRMSAAGQEVPAYELTYPRDIANPNC